MAISSLPRNRRFQIRATAGEEAPIKSANSQSSG